MHALGGLGSDFLAKRILETDQRLLLRLVIISVAEQNGGHGCQCGVQGFGQTGVVLQQVAAIGGVGALLDVLPVLDLIFVATVLRLEGLVREAARHDAVDEIDRLGLLRLSGLERVGFDVLDRARVNLVAIALVGSMVAGELGL